MKSFLLLSFLLSHSVHAGVSVEMDGKSYGCERKSESILHCAEGDTKILVVKNFMGFSAIEKKGNSLPQMKWLSKVTQDEKVLYEIPKLNFPGLIVSNNKSDSEQSKPSSPYGGGMFGGFKPMETKAGKMINASGIINNLKGIDDELAKAFAEESRAYVEQETSAKNKLKILSGGKKFDCDRGGDRPLSAEEKKYEQQYNTRMQCNFYSCKGPEGEKVLGYIPSPGTMANPYFVVQKGESSELKFDDLTVVDHNDEKGTPLFSVPKISNYGGGYGGMSALDENLFIPKKFEKNKSTFSFYTNPFSGPMREAGYNLCQQKGEVAKLIAEDKKTEELFKNELINMELSHYLTLVNGQMLSVYIDAAKSKGLGCHYDNMILSQEAAKHLEWLQKANRKPAEKYLTEEEVQDLFLKAKNMPDIPFGYKYDGCYARAHVMARRFEAMGIPTEKVWIKGSLYVPGTDVQWNYHVAPVVSVKTKNGEIKKFVIDPSLNEKAVTVDGWVDSMGKNVKGGVVKTPYPFPVNVATFQRTAVAISSSDIYVPDNDEVRTEEENMAMAIQTMKEYSEALKQKTQNPSETQYENQHVRPDTI